MIDSTPDGLSWHEGSIRFDLRLRHQPAEVLAVMAQALALVSPRSPGRARLMEHLRDGTPEALPLIRALFDRALRGHPG